MPDPSPIPVSVVVLAFNSAAYLPVCLTELASSRGVELEVIVVDNASKDHSAEVAEKHACGPKVIRTERNLGCAGGNNVGWRAARHPFVVFINPDCAVDFDTLRRLTEPLRDDATIGLTGAKLLYPHSRRLQHAGGLMHPNAMAEHWGAREKAEDTGQYDSDRDVDFVTGALMAARREELVGLGGFDEEFFPAYYEETDFCARLRASGRRIRYIAGARGWHWESVEVGLFSPRLRRLHYAGRMIYLVKNTPLAAWFTRVIPSEIAWLTGPYAPGFRGYVLRSYLSGVVFAFKCLMRYSRRPPGVRRRLPAPTQ